MASRLKAQGRLRLHDTSAAFLVPFFYIYTDCTATMQSSTASFENRARIVLAATSKEISIDPDIEVLTFAYNESIQLSQEVFERFLESKKTLF